MSASTLVRRFNCLLALAMSATAAAAQSGRMTTIVTDSSTVAINSATDASTRLTLNNAPRTLETRGAASDVYSVRTLASSVPDTVMQDPIVTNDPAFMAVFLNQYKQAFGDGAIPAKYKQLSGATLSVVVKCEDCLRYHVQMAIKLGATRQEIVEALRIGLLTGGSAGMPAMGAAYGIMEQAKLK